MSPLIKHPKRRGEWVEMQFMARAASHGFTVSKPWGDSARYDFVVEHKAHFSRVQVKSTTCYRPGHGYSCKFCRFTGSYSEREVDFLAVFVIPEDVWYVIPINQVAGMQGTALEPRRSNNKYFRYMEAWHLLKQGPADARSSA